MIGFDRTEAVEFVGDRMSLPAVAKLAGPTVPKGRCIGRRGGIVSAFGVTVAPNLAQFGSTLAEVRAKVVRGKARAGSGVS